MVEQPAAHPSVVDSSDICKLYRVNDDLRTQL